MRGDRVGDLAPRRRAGHERRIARSRSRRAREARRIAGVQCVLASRQCIMPECDAEQDASRRSPAPRPASGSPARSSSRATASRSCSARGAPIGSTRRWRGIRAAGGRAECGRRWTSRANRTCMRLVARAREALRRPRHHDLQRRLRLLRHGRRDAAGRHAADDGRQLHGHRSTARARRCPIFRRQGRGHLILISSIVGRRGIAQMSGYSATKAAQVGFAESLRAEFAGTDIHVSVVFPVSTETEFRDAMAARLRPLASRASDRSSRSDDVARADRRLRATGRAPEVYPHAAVARRSRSSTPWRPAFADRLVQQVRPAPEPCARRDPCSRR